MVDRLEGARQVVTRWGEPVREWALDGQPARVAQAHGGRDRLEHQGLIAFSSTVLTQYYRGSKDAQAWHDLCSAVQGVDLTLKEVHTTYHGVCAALDGDDRLEHWINMLGAEPTFHCTGIAVARLDLQPGRALGNAHDLPAWVMHAARSTTKGVFQQNGTVKAHRVWGRGCVEAGAEDDVGALPKRCDRRRAGRKGDDAAAPKGRGCGA